MCVQSTEAWVWNQFWRRAAAAAERTRGRLVIASHLSIGDDYDDDDVDVDEEEEK